MFQVLPWVAFTGDTVHFWVHYGLVILGFILAVITAVVQWVKPAPYGKHSAEGSDWGPGIPQRLAHTLSDAIPGVGLFVLVFHFYGKVKSAPNYVLLAMFLLHYIYRGVIHPLITRYSKPTVPLGIMLGGFFPNCLYHYMNADWIGSAAYASNYFYDPRFILGALLFLCGFGINKWADWKLRSLRDIQGSRGYYIPHGGMYELISCPNYFGELVEWIGWALATWSLAGLVWCLFSAATFVPRARHNHVWYKEHFQEYPSNRRALIPFLY